MSPVCACDKYISVAASNALNLFFSVESLGVKCFSEQPLKENYSTLGSHTNAVAVISHAVAYSSKRLAKPCMIRFFCLLTAAGLA